MQILAGLARDASTARFVNVLPSDSPQDAYKAVAELAKPNCPENIREHVTRKVAKRLVMTIPYNAKFKSNWGYVKEAFEEAGLDVSKEDVTAVTHALRDAVFELFPGPSRVMEWINSEVVECIKDGAESIEWVTPSGFMATQRYYKAEMKRYDLQLLGSIRMNVAVGETDEVDLNHHRNATSPNLIHSLDASLLHLSVLRFDAPIALIHDSVLCRATDMSCLSTIVRETYMHLFAEHDYLTDFARQIGAKTDPPIIGDLEPESVIESTYFFC
jgi:DNA-directed RNA polymerase